jgi:Zn-dependent protease with chaperone function
MERESLLIVLLVLMGGFALQLIAASLATAARSKGHPEPEQVAWFRLLRPLIPALLVTACLCGWALSQPDPVPDRVGPLLFIVCAPFGLIGVRAVLRAGWALFHEPTQHGIATVGLIRPRIVVTPELARCLDERAMRAALAHERAHVRHLDPFRIWVAQFVTDLQWPWSSAQRRFESWLLALEHARDDEARAEGVDGADLAAALIASIRFQHSGGGGICAPLIAEKSALEQRVARLLQPLDRPTDHTPTVLQVAALLAVALTAALALGAFYGERLVVGPLLAVS